MGTGVRQESRELTRAIDQIEKRLAKVESGSNIKDLPKDATTEQIVAKLNEIIRVLR